MKKRIVCFCFVLFSAFVQAQHGLEKIVIEKYYISDANDSASTDGLLPVGSVTYRIYADMLPSFRFQAAYGVPDHELRIATTTFFYNNKSEGAVTANDIPKVSLKNNTVMLDSWISVGAGSEGNSGILKSDDTTEAVINSDGMLQNEDPSTGIPIKKRDGLVALSPQSVVYTFGLDSAITVFEKQNNGPNGSVFSTTNGSWASFNGSIGPTPDNRVLIAQITTDGVFSFELNIQIGTPDGGVLNYVAKNPTGNEIQLPSLIYPVANTNTDNNRGDFKGSNKKLVKK